MQVQAYTNSEGPSAIAYVNTSIESPIPSLIIATQDSIHITDLDLNKHNVLLNGISMPTEIAYLAAENKLFWINDMQELFMYNIETAVKSKIFDVNGTIISLTLDWIERSLYYVQINTDIEGSSVYKLDLNLIDKGLRITQIFRTPSLISSIEVSPFTK